MSPHKEAPIETKFCSKRKGSCCGYHYRTDCLPGWTPYQAHHVAPCAEVPKLRGMGQNVADAVDSTKWCVNRTPNMLALPTWAGTLEHYCTLAISGKSLVAPAWENWPQHTNDHGLYNREVEEALSVIAEAVAMNLEKNHKDTSGNLAGELNSASDDFREALRTRGKRCGGTHAAWNQATLAPNSNWYMPFSMTASPTARTYPLSNFDATTAQQILREYMSLTKW